MLGILGNSKGLVALGRPSHARMFESRGPGLRIGCYGHETPVAVTNVHVHSQQLSSRTECAHGYCSGLRPECVSCGTVTDPINSRAEMVLCRSSSLCDDRTDQAVWAPARHGATGWHRAELA
jgi:hypothetical protein